MLPYIFDMIYLMLLLLLCFALLGVLLFGLSSFGAELDQQYGSVAVSLQTMLILLTTCNFPDVMLPVYQVRPHATFSLIHPNPTNNPFSLT